jgi:F-type H+-transporting ATPase subunit delta
MAGELQLARRYARAYFELAKQAKDIPGWRAALDDVVSLLTHPDVKKALTDPRVPKHERVRVVAELLKDAGPAARNLARLLVERGRVAILPRVLEEYDLLADRESGVLRAEVVTAVPVDARLEKRIREQLAAKLGGDVQTTVRQDPSILGGLVIRIGDRVIDGSVRTRLAQLTPTTRVRRTTRRHGNSQRRDRADPQGTDQLLRGPRGRRPGGRDHLGHRRHRAHLRPGEGHGR